jgi:hypothetical protein
VSRSSRPRPRAQLAEQTRLAAEQRVKMMRFLADEADKVKV